MNFQQLRYVRETLRQGLNLTEAAKKLFTSQPGVSKQIRELENELGVEIFVRHGKRIVALTEPGKAAVEVIERLLQETENLKQVGREFQDQAAGTLTIATTHTQARYSLPKVVSAFKRRYPKVHLTLKQGNPPQLAEMVIAGEADIAIATEALDNYPKLLALPGYQWQHCVVVPAKHPLAKERRVTLDTLAQHPIVTYDPAFAGRSRIDQAFQAQGLTPDIVLSAVDSDVIKTYVELGMGIGIIAAMAFDEKRDRQLRALEAGHLFGTMTTRVAVRRGTALRGFAYTFIELFSSQLTRKLIDAALAGKGETYEL
jgi:LysR family transcriptional regulator, cys regulon transcriptional activator